MVIPKQARWLRWLTIFWALIVFIWLGQEDNHVLPVAVLGIVGASVMLLLWAVHYYGNHAIGRGVLPFLLTAGGAVNGLGGVALTVGLMIFKNVRHAHLAPDYPNGLMGAMINLAPAWMLAGACFGLGIGLIYLALNQPK
jgi:hypothetical protein